MSGVQSGSSAIRHASNLQHPRGQDLPYANRRGRRVGSVRQCRFDTRSIGLHDSVIARHEVVGLRGTPGSPVPAAGVVHAQVHPLLAGRTSTEWRERSAEPGVPAASVRDQRHAGLAAPLQPYTDFLPALLGNRRPIQSSSNSNSSSFGPRASRMRRPPTSTGGRTITASASARRRCSARISAAPCV